MDHFKAFDFKQKIYISIMFTVLEVKEMFLLISENPQLKIQTPHTKGFLKQKQRNISN